MTKLEPVYLGDGLYASFDGFNIWLTGGGGRVALEPETLVKLDEYRRKIDKEYNVKRYAPKTELTE